MIKWYAISRMIALLSVDHCVSYMLVVLIIKWCGDTGMIYKWVVGVYLIKHDQFLDTLLSRVACEGYGYKYPSDLRSPWWLASNSLCFGAGLSEFLIQWWKISGRSQVLVKSVCESRCSTKELRYTHIKDT